MYKWIAGVYWDEPACDGSQPVFGTWQRAQGKTAVSQDKWPRIVFWGFFVFFFKQMMEIMIRCYSPVFLNRRWIDQERLLFIIRGLQSYRRKHPSKLCCRWEKWPRVKSSPVSSVGSDWVAAVCLLCRQDLTWLLCLWVCITCVFMIFFFLFQVIMTVLCQCSQRCSWSVRRKDCSYQAPSPLLVSIW